MDKLMYGYLWMIVIAMDCYDIIIDYYVLLHYFYDDLLSLHVDPLELRFFYHAYTKGELRTKYLLDYNVC